MRYPSIKLTLNSKKRFEQIRGLSLMIQSTKLKSLKEIRLIARSIELLTEDKELKSLKKALEDVKKENILLWKNLNLNLGLVEVDMSGIKIINVQVVGICSKCRTENDEILKWKDGTIIEDKDISCLSCALGGAND